MPSMLAGTRTVWWVNELIGPVYVGLQGKNQQEMFKGQILAQKKERY